MKLLRSFVVVLSLFAFSETGATDFASLSTPQVEALLTSQAHNEWGDELLKAFPAGAETDDWSDLPITLFPALRNTGTSRVSEQFNEWCSQHLKAAKKRNRYGNTLVQLTPGSDERSERQLVERLAACTADEDLSPILRLSALGAVVNVDHQQVTNSLLLFCLRYLNENEAASRRACQTDSKSLAESGRNPENPLPALFADGLAVLQQQKNALVLAGYLATLADATVQHESVVNLGQEGGNMFVPPFSLAHGDPARIFRIEVRRLTSASDVPRQNSPIVVSERQVLNSYRTELVAGTTFTAGTVARHELFKFVDQWMSRLEDERRKKAPLTDEQEEALTLVLSRLLQIDDIAVQLRLTSHLQSDVDSLLHEEPPQEGPRTRLARGVLNVLQSTAAEPKRLFGVSVVDAYESMLQLRRTAEDVEQSIVAAGLGKSR